jgi:hypothetical protein
MLSILEKIKQHATEEFEPYQVSASNKDLFKLVRLGILEIVYKSNKNTVYRVADINKLEQLIKYKTTKINLDNDKPLFDSIVGYDKHKELLLKCINSPNPIHVILLGSPATAKTLFLLELTKLPNSEYITAYITYSGLFDILLNEPEFLLVEQIDNIKDNNVYKLLLDICEYGYITKSTHIDYLKTKINTKVFATANNLDRLPESLISRFLIIKFPVYKPEEYRQIAFNVLQNYTNDINLINYIIEKTIMYRDIRNAIKLAKICNSTEEVDKYLSIISF